MPKPEAPNYTPEQIAEAARIIKATFDPETGRHPLELFHAISSTTLRPTVELAIFDVTKEEILLTEREHDDPHFSDMWHMPGVMVVTSDMTSGPYSNAFHNAAVRAIGELEGTRITSLLPLSPKWVNQDPREGPRGGEATLVYGALLVDDKPSVGGMFKVGALPEPIYEHHPQLILDSQRAMTIAPAIDMSIM